MNLNKVISSLLVVSLLSSSFSINAFATSAGSSAGEQETGTSNATTNYGNGSWDVQANTGFRFTVIDGSTRKVSNFVCFFYWKK